MESTDIKRLKLINFLKDLALGLFLVGFLWRLKGENGLGEIFEFSALFFFLVSLIAPELLKGFYEFNLTFIKKLGNFISLLLMWLVYYLLLIPYGFVIKLWKKDLLDKNFKKSQKSYWSEIEDNNDYEKLY